MRIKELTPAQLRTQCSDGLDIHVGPFLLRLTTRFPDLVRSVAFLYAEFPVATVRGIVDFDVAVRKFPLLPWRASVYLDGAAVHKLIPRSRIVPLFEWSVNINQFALPQRYLLIHSAVLERNGFAALFPAPSGSGKSTLCAALAYRGWRLFSDEVAMIDPVSGSLAPIPRPISLKNESIDLIRRLCGDTVLSPTAHTDFKGNVAYLRPPAESVHRSGEPAVPRWLIFPQYQAGSSATLEPLARSEAFLQAADNSFNYHLLGELGFESLARVVERCECFRFVYDDLEQAAECLERLSANDN